MPEFNNIYLHPYRYNSLINGDKWDYFMKSWCGYAPEQGKLNDVISYLEEIKQMPCYPDDGSIKIIDNNIRKYHLFNIFLLLISLIFCLRSGKYVSVRNLYVLSLIQWLEIKLIDHIPEKH